MADGFIDLTNMYYFVLLITGFLLGLSVGSAKKLKKKNQTEVK